jgi:hypothetical protein
MIRAIQGRASSTFDVDPDSRHALARFSRIGVSSAGIEWELDCKETEAPYEKTGNGYSGTGY